MSGTRARKPQVVILNGVGSVGKSSIAAELQSIAAAPFLHVEMDAFIEMLPQRYWGHPDGFAFETFEEDGRPCVRILTGPIGARALAGMWGAVAAMAGQGADLIVDVVLEGAADLHRVTLPDSADLRMVGLFAPLHALEARERQREDRLVGLARWQFDRVHQGIVYDLEIDTSAATPLQCARQIKQAFRL
jgi:chloramphenicol 3-O phosphotransferase